jgi:hypothetical protein
MADRPRDRWNVRIAFALETGEDARDGGLELSEPLAKPASLSSGAQGATWCVKMDRRHAKRPDDVQLHAQSLVNACKYANRPALGRLSYANAVRSNSRLLGIAMRQSSSPSNSRET